MISAADLITSSSCVFPLGDRTVIQVTGRDRATFLHNFCTNDVQSLQPGDGCEAFVTDVKGHVLGLVLLFAQSDAILVWTVTGQAEALIAHWDRYCIREQVAFLDQSSQWTSFCLQSNHEAAEVADRAPRRLSHFETGDEDQRLWLARGLLDDLATWLCLVPTESADTVISLGHSVGATVGTWADFDALRVAHGVPEFGRDVTGDNLPQEVNRDRQAISFRKGCYLGQETVARIDALGHVNRLLVRLRFPEGQLPETGIPLMSDASDRPIGGITSVAACRQTVGGVGLGYVRREFATAETVLRSPAGAVEVV